MMNNKNVYFNKSIENQYDMFLQSEIMDNLPQNIDIFSELIDVIGKVNDKTQKSYDKLMNSIKIYLKKIEDYKAIKNNLSKLKNHIDEDNEVQIEWIIRNSFRIGFLIDDEGDISFWKLYKEGTITNTISDVIEMNNINEKVNGILNEVISLT